MTKGKSDPSRIESQIDDNLRRIFEQDVEDELPDRLRKLVDQLDAQCARTDDDDDDDGEDGSGDGGASGGGQDEPSDGPTRGAAAAGALTLPRAADRAATPLRFAKEFR